MFDKYITKQLYHKNKWLKINHQVNLPHSLSLGHKILPRKNLYPFTKKKKKKETKQLTDTKQSKKYHKIN